MAVRERESRGEGVADNSGKADGKWPAGRSGRDGLLGRNRDFRQLWYAETTGKSGAAVTGVLLPPVAVSALHAGTSR
ncbi:hypothetical protein ACH4PU_30005 [Streptomyces sp. NPDC021100]|uniref:hypothetical protein n=1 Tax=Streptomyces sp. NPDC021100 TaxID=3365114 RepID=UPI0037A2197B